MALKNFAAGGVGLWLSCPGRRFAAMHVGQRGGGFCLEVKFPVSETVPAEAGVRMRDRFFR